MKTIVVSVRIVTSFASTSPEAESSAKGNAITVGENWQAEIGSWILGL